MLCDFLRITTVVLAFTLASTLALATLPISVAFTFAFPFACALSVRITTFAISIAFSFASFPISIAFSFAVALTISITLTRLVAIIFLFRQSQQSRIQIRFEDSRSFRRFFILSPCRQAESNSDDHSTGTNQSQLSIHRSLSFMGHQEFRSMRTPRMETS
jgi:hypothetical protein